MARRRSRETDWRPAFLDALVERWTMREACLAVGVGRTTVHEARKADPDFDAMVKAAQREIVERLEKEAFRRAVEGWTEREERDADGNMIARTVKYSDRMLEMLLRANAPGKYRENVYLEASGSIEQQLTVTLVDGNPSGLTSGPRQAAAALLMEDVIDGVARDLPVNGHGH